VRFALYCPRQSLAWESILPLWLEADQIPLFESAWTFDHMHIYPVDLVTPEQAASARPVDRSAMQRAKDMARTLRYRFRSPLGPCLEGWTTLTALLQATKRIRGGCLVTAMPYRHPAVLAKMAATVDIISGGRLELGLGAGWCEEESSAYGIELGSWGERFDRFDEGVQCILGLLSGESTTFAGRYYSLVDAPCAPKSVQRPYPPVLIGGAGEKRTIPAVARWATIWQAGFDGSTLPRKLDILSAACAKVGRDPAEITVAMTEYWDGRFASKFADRVARLSELGADMVMISVAGNDPRVLGRLADAVAPLSNETAPRSGDRVAFR
jgi:alkanesulfonate monooxygenase SsuD/methylene tetrahydromethanopterin reductase-like flavin-dependent oxidoreductase (luciferase family)